MRTSHYFALYFACFGLLAAQPQPSTTENRAFVQRYCFGAVLGVNGLHGFSFVTPAAVKDGAAHTITVRPAGSAAVLAGARILNCVP